MLFQRPGQIAGPEPEQPVPVEGCRTCACEPVQQTIGHGMRVDRHAQHCIEPMLACMGKGGA